MRRLALALALVALMAGDAAAWSDIGHQAIGHAAQSLLNERATAAIARTLGLPSLPEGELARMATWPDDIRRLQNIVPPPWEGEALREAQGFVAQFPDHPAWHYVNLPLGTAYPATRKAFTRPNDVVGTILRCIAVLEGRETVAGLTNVIALRFLIHLVGDVHQPLHATAGYFDVSDLAAPRLLRDPARVARGAVNDLGGNRLAFGMSNLHATWDHGVVVALGAPDARALSVELRALITQLRIKPLGDQHLRGPRAWATEASQVAAETAYRGLEFGPARLKPDSTEVERIEIVAPAYSAYVRDPVVLGAAKRQLARAAARLAELLNRLRWL